MTNDELAKVGYTFWRPRWKWEEPPRWRNQGGESRTTGFQAAPSMSLTFPFLATRLWRWPITQKRQTDDVFKFVSPFPPLLHLSPFSSLSAPSVYENTLPSSLLSPRSFLSQLNLTYHQVGGPHFISNMATTKVMNYLKRIKNKTWKKDNIVKVRKTKRQWDSETVRQ